MTTQTNVNQQMNLEKQTTKTDIAILFIGDVAISFAMVKMFLSGDLTTIENKIFLLALGLYATINPYVRDGMLTLYKSEKKKDLLRLYLHPWFSIFLVFTVELILFACKQQNTRNSCKR